MIKRLVTAICVGLCLATSLSSHAQWSKKVDFSGDPNIYNLFSEVSFMERGIVRFVAIDALEGAMNGEKSHYDDVQINYQPEDDYFLVHEGAPDSGSGDDLWQEITAKMWRPSGAGNYLLGTYLVDHSPQEEYRYLYFYEFDPQTRMLKSVPRPFETGYDDSELRYNLRPNGDIEVLRWGESLMHLYWDGSRFRPRSLTR